MGGSIASEARRIRKIAEAGPIGKRHTSFELYSLLGECMTLAERCRSSPEEADEMRRLVANQPTTRQRRYVEGGSDSFLLVSRYVFADLRSAAANRSNASRYAHAMRIAFDAGIRGAALAEHLRDNGGINSLFVKRPLLAVSVSTKTLHLTSSVTLPKQGAARLTLSRSIDGRFDVHEVETL